MPKLLKMRFRNINRVIPVACLSGRSESKRCNKEQKTTDYVSSQLAYIIHHTLHTMKLSNFPAITINQD